MPHSLLKWLRNRSQCKDGRSRLTATVRGLASIKNKKLPTLLNEILNVRILIFSASGSKRKSSFCAKAWDVTPSSKNWAVNKLRGKQRHREVKRFAQSHTPGHWQSQWNTIKVSWLSPTLETLLHEDSQINIQELTRRRKKELSRFIDMWSLVDSDSYRIMSSSLTRFFFIIPWKCI